MKERDELVMKEKEKSIVTQLVDASGQNWQA